MGKLTKMITYNVHERGRKLTGQDRRFNLKALAALINGPEVQESVKSGDMQGYFGHWPRVKFGMQTKEGGVLDGKAVSLPLAVRAVHLSCDELGNITHQHEFLDTHEGRLASSLYDSNTGGFSSAIDPVPRTSPTIPAMFHGFDFVLSPNYNTNRGHAVLLDSVGAEPGSEEREDMIAILDAVAHESSVAIGMFDALHAQHLLALETIARLSEEQDLMIGRLAAGQIGQLDDIMGDGAGRIAPVKGVRPDFAQYRDMPLERLSEIKRPRDDSAESAQMRRYGMDA